MDGPEPMRLHVLKCESIYFRALIDGAKTFEVRLADRDYQIGDVLLLREYIAEKRAYTGRFHLVVVTYMLEGPFRGLLNEDAVAMAINPLLHGYHQEPPLQGPPPF